MRSLDRRLPALGDLALLLLRLVAGGLLVAHGAQKLFVFGLGGTVESFAGMGVPMPAVAAPVAIVVELVLGLALVLGVALPVVGTVVALYMLGVLVIAHAPFGPFVTDGGWELVALFAVSAAVLAVIGGGRFGVDGALAARRPTDELVGAR